MQMALDCLVPPDSIDITIEDIGGLHDIFERLVSTLNNPPMSVDRERKLQYVHVRQTQAAGMVLYFALQCPN